MPRSAKPFPLILRRCVCIAWLLVSTFPISANVPGYTFCTAQPSEYNANNQLWLVLGTNSTVTTFGYGASGERLWELRGTNSLQVWIGGIYEEKNGQILY